MRSNIFITSIGIVLGVATLLSAVSRAEPPDRMNAIAGTWVGKGSLYLPLAQKKAPSDMPADNPDIQIIINPDGTVTGKVGDAEFRECFVTENRGWFGRLINIRSDYIVKDGYLEGRLCSKDKVNQKKFTLPFNIRGGLLKGTIMQIHKWRYPDPLVRVRLSNSGKPRIKNR